MKTYNLDKIVHYVLKSIEERRLAPGTYVRWHIQNSWGGKAYLQYKNNAWARLQDYYNTLQ